MQTNAESNFYCTTRNLGNLLMKNTVFYPQSHSIYCNRQFRTEDWCLKAKNLLQHGLNKCNKDKKHEAINLIFRNAHP